jgi:hypothetical protein
MKGMMEMITIEVIDAAIITTEMAGVSSGVSDVITVFTATRKKIVVGAGIPLPD